MTTMTQAAEAIEKSRSASAAGKRVQIVMNHTGETRYEFDAADLEAVAQAQERFLHLTGSGFRAAALSGDGSPGRLIRSFDQAVERTLFIPQLKGG
jgi:hypothetical protein